ncbi:MAG: hypothetical protein ACPH9T_09180, partial [Paracoccaceae bacterium]
MIDGDLSQARINEVLGATNRFYQRGAKLLPLHREWLMADLSLQNPGYGWEKNAGYPSKQHISALQRLGVTPHHRRSFRPVHNILYQENK